ncbi:thiamine phosphate synthase [Alienimonas chondri]|uniref:Thiamine-phosphate synthase n=1 Tax=Alienimonas chondri TaxID=2681879 RepID=A0ABX1V8D7_9PLAN|nr:thiamine phosphate synthase [Alienimonas chondri]NNJ24079.1 Thiamine-phosphate synthase [Alienimonas chondri]
MPSDPATLRLLDAAENRAREGLRVLEDHARFVLNDGGLTAELKSIRHGLASVLPIDRLARCDARETAGDVGTTLSEPTERSRSDAAAVIAANAARVQEALRSLEEWSKLDDPERAAAFEALRYRVYTLEKRLAGTLARPSLGPWRLYLLLTRSACVRPWREVLKAVCEAGVGPVQVREKNLSDRELLAHLRDVRAITAAAGVPLIVNDRPDLARLCGADGVHLGDEDLPIEPVRAMLGERALIGASTHRPEDATAALAAGADHLGVGPCFPSATKSFEAFPGSDYLRWAAEHVAVPWYAIGGIDRATIETAVAAGATRVAVCGAICGADDPGRAAADLLASLPNASDDPHPSATL